MTQSEPLVSVNIPTLNSAATLAYCLEAVRLQSYKNLEVIVIDSFSSDGTPIVAKEHGAKVLSAKGLLKQRLTGIKASKGKYILLLDSDQVLEKNAIKECVEFERSCTKPTAIVLNEISVPLAKGRIAEAQAEYVKMIHKGDFEPVLGTALPRFFPLDILKQVAPTSREIGYFDHVYLYNQMTQRNIDAKYCPQAIVHHYEINTIKRMFKKFFKYYGFYVLPALVEDSSLVVARVLPRRMMLKSTGNSDDYIDKRTQMLLYGVKALATFSGTIFFVFSSVINRARGK